MLTRSLTHLSRSAGTIGRPAIRTSVGVSVRASLRLSMAPRQQQYSASLQGGWLSSSLFSSLCTSNRHEHTASTTTTTTTTPALNTQVDELMESFAEARELVKDAMESVGTTYFGEDMQDAEQQTADVLQRWAAVQKFLEDSGETAELQTLRNMHSLKLRQLEAELETVREAGGSG